jgi:hypothetical protein
MSISFGDLRVEARDVETKIKSSTEEHENMLKDLTTDEANKSRERVQLAITKAENDPEEAADFEPSWPQFLRDLSNRIEEKKIYLKALKGEISLLTFAKGSS